VAEMGAVGKLIGNDVERLVHLADHRGDIAHLPRSMPWPWPVGGAAVPRNADEADLDVLGRFKRHMRQSHEGRNPAETRGNKPRDGLVEPGLWPILHPVSPKRWRGSGAIVRHLR